MGGQACRIGEAQATVIFNFGRWMDHVYVHGDVVGNVDVIGPLIVAACVNVNATLIVVVDVIVAVHVNTTLIAAVDLIDPVS